MKIARTYSIKKDFEDVKSIISEQSDIEILWAKSSPVNLKSEDSILFRIELQNNNNKKKGMFVFESNHRALNFLIDGSTRIELIVFNEEFEKEVRRCLSLLATE